MKIRLLITAVATNLLIPCFAMEKLADDPHRRGAIHHREFVKLPNKEQLPQDQKAKLNEQVRALRRANVSQGEKEKLQAFLEEQACWNHLIKQEGQLTLPMPPTHETTTTTSIPGGSQTSTVTVKQTVEPLRQEYHERVSYTRSFSHSTKGKKTKFKLG